MLHMYVFVKLLSQNYSNIDVCQVPIFTTGTNLDYIDAIFDLHFNALFGVRVKFDEFSEAMVLTEVIR